MSGGLKLEDPKGLFVWLQWPSTFATKTASYIHIYFRKIFHSGPFLYRKLRILNPIIELQSLFPGKNQFLLPALASYTILRSD